MSEKLLSAVVGGVQKGGTTSLYHYFAQHPEIADQSVKELHFFDNESRNWTDPDYRELDGFFPNRVPTQLACDFTPIYLFWNGALERIRHYDSQMRLIFLFRDPIERAWSHWCMEYARQHETLEFATAIREGRARLPPDNRTDHAWRIFSYVERGFYGQQLDRVFSLFGREQVLLLRAADLAHSPGDVLGQVSQFLGIAPFPDAAPRRDNVRPAITYPSQLTQHDQHYLRDLYAADFERFRELSGLAVNDWLIMQN